MTVTPLNAKRVEYRACPSCGHRISQTAIEILNVDVLCVWCREHRVSEFTPVFDKEG